jgi:hypothetical protein
VADVTFRLTILETPVAGAPILFNDVSENTDDNGEVTTTLNLLENYTISSGIEAISFTPLLDSGANFAAMSPVSIEATRLIEPVQNACRLIVGGTTNIYFSAENVQDHTLTVPLSYDKLNVIYSVTGQAQPPENFAPGTSGFTVPERYFRQPNNNLAGIWKFLGTSVTLDPDPPFCTDTGTPGQCEVLDTYILRSPFEYTRKVVIRLTRLSLEAAAAGKWRPSNGSFSVPFFARGATAMAAMEKTFKAATGQNFVCEVIPTSTTCVTKIVPKKALVRAFSGIFAGKVPRGLEPIAARANRETTAFEKYLRRLPNRYTNCDASNADASKSSRKTVSIK